MNIVFDNYLSLDNDYREALAAILPGDNAYLKLNSFTEKTDSNPIADEGFVFITELSTGELKYHSTFFERYKDAPQWFFVLLNKNDHGIIDLKNAARKHNLKNPNFFHAANLKMFKFALNSINSARTITKGKALLFSKHTKKWMSDLANILFNDESKYEIMDSLNVTDSDSDTLLLCGEKMDDFEGIELPGNMEPYFIFRLKGELQFFIDPRTFIDNISKYYDITAERVESRLYFIDIEIEHWLKEMNKTTGDDAVAKGILIWDSFGLPVSHSEYIESNIEKNAKKCHKNVERLLKDIF